MGYYQSIMKRRQFIHSLNLGLATGGLLGITDLASALTPNRLINKELQYHKIEKIVFSTVRLQYPRLVGKNARLDLHGYGPNVDICVIKTDQGAQGWASLRGSINDAQKLTKDLVGKQVSEIFDPQIGLIDAKYLPFDIALHDLSGHILNKPVYSILGNEKPFTTAYYSGMIYFDDLEPSHSPAGIDRILEECAFDYKLGYRQFKLKIGRGHRWMPFDTGLQRDIDVTKKVAQSFPDCEILVDGNNGFAVNEFIQYLEAITPTKLFWIEEPFHETVADYSILKSWMDKEGFKTLLADGEADPDPVLLNELMEKKLLDVHLTDIEGLGFTNWRKLMPDLKRLGVQASPHAWGSLLKSYYTAHLAGGLGNTVTIEGVTSTSEDVDFSGYKVQNGKLIPPSTPGFGMPLLKKI